MPSCIVPGCTSGYTSNPGKFHFFVVPKDPAIAACWGTAIKRSDISAKRGKTVCENHFRKEEILWERQLLGPDGNVVGVSTYRIPRLRQGSIPSLFPWTEIDEASPMETDNPSADVSQPCQRDSTTPENIDVNDSGTENFIAAAKEILDASAATANLTADNSTTPSPLITFSELSSAEILLPPGWILEKKLGEQKKLMIIFTNKIVEINEIPTPFILKALVVKSDLSIGISVFGRPVDLEEFGMPRGITDLKQLEDLLNIVNGFNVCSGCTGPSVETEMRQLKCSTIRKDTSGVWRHDSCRLLLQKVSICRFCHTAKKSLAARFRRWKSSHQTNRTPFAVMCPTQKERWLKLQSKYRCALRDKKQAQQKMKKINSELRQCREKMAHLSNFNVEEQLANGNLSKNEAYVVKQIFDAAKHRNSKGRNYSEEWMLLCMLLHMRSPCGYEFLRSNEILPLPCVRTVRRYLSKMKTSCGFDQQFLQVLKLALEKKTEKQRHGILLFDEMATRESVSVDSKNLTYKGLIDFGDDGPRSSDFSEKANHGLVFMFQPLEDEYTQPIAAFASRGPVKGTVLAQLVLKAIVLLEEAGAKIHGVVSDGASTNRKFWSEVGVNGAKDGFRNYFNHPSVEGRKIFVFSDTPHLIKTIRNRLHNNRVLRMDPADSEIRWEYLELLEKEDRALAGLGQVLVCPKLTRHHVYLKNAMKMRVRLATQVFSNSVAGGLRFFQKRLPAFADCEATAEFCKWMNDLFDALNRKHPIDGMQPGNKDFRMIEDSLRKLNAWEDMVKSKQLLKDMFLTTQTAEGLRVTLQSTLDLVQYLTENFEFTQVLTGRVNQDPLEKFFGAVRQAGGCNDHPATPTFLNIYKILSTFSVLKPPKSGNCSVRDNSSLTPLISLSELKAIYSNSNASIDHSESVKKLKERLEQIVQNDDDWHSNAFLEHDYCMPEVADCALYCLTAAIAKRVLNTVTCMVCKEGLISPDAEGSFLPQAELAHWQQRALITHPNKRLYTFVVFLENKFEQHCKSSTVFEEVLDEVFNYNGLSFPCPEHAVDVIFEVIKYFISMRMQQYCTRINADQQKNNCLKKKTAKFCTT